MALFYGNSKPTCLSEFLSDFLGEIDSLKENGIAFNDKTISVSLLTFVCDAPARAFLKCIKGHTGYNFCERCSIPGSYKNNRVHFYSKTSFPLRSNEDFANMLYDNHQRAHSSLIDHNFPCVSGFCLDYMHLVCLGVVKRIIWYLKQGPRDCRLSSRQLLEISDNLVSLHGKMPSEFARQPRSLEELERWKATEFRQFLLYTGPVVLRKIVSKKKYEHFLTLTVGISILLDSNENKRNSYREYARELLEYFVRESKNIYSEIFVSYNVHNLIHITDDVEKYNCSLNSISAFPFENHLQAIKCLVRNAKNPISQVTKRMAEMDTFGSGKTNNMSGFQIGTISCKKKDSYFLLFNEEFAFVKEKRDDGKLVCDVVKQRDCENYFKKPCESKFINIAFIKKRHRSSRRLLEKKDLYRKVACLPCPGGYVSLPLLHGVERRRH